MLICTCRMIIRSVSDDKAGVSTEDNPAYGLSSPHGRHGENKEYEHIQSSPAAPQETVYEGVF